MLFRSQEKLTYTWGNEKNPEGKWLANIWQGKFPNGNTLQDGFKLQSPVGSFPANGYGLHDMAGNIGASLFPFALGKLVSGTGNWNVTLLLFASMLAVSALCWALLNPKRPLFAEAP